MFSCVWCGWDVGGFGRGWCVFECIGGGVVVHLSVWMDSAFLPPGSLLMVAALCGVGEN